MEEDLLLGRRTKKNHSLCQIPWVCLEHQKCQKAHPIIHSVSPWLPRKPGGHLELFFLWSSADHWIPRAHLWHGIWKVLRGLCPSENFCAGEQLSNLSPVGPWTRSSSTSSSSLSLFLPVNWLQPFPVLWFSVWRLFVLVKDEEALEGLSQEEGLRWAWPWAQQDDNEKQTDVFTT
jgi:hypothetical protein